MKLQTLKTHKLFTVICYFVAVSLLLSCNATRTQKGGAIGAGSGAVIGGVIGNRSGNTAVGAIIGAAVGGATGALIGRRMDKQAEELSNDLKGANVERVGEGIKITFDSGLMFDLNKSNLSAATETNLSQLASTLNKYDDTNILIEGHTDASGTNKYNQELSEKRAASVRSFLLAQQVAAQRMTAIGYGEEQPIASNKTNSGSQKNRRVEVAIFANERMKKAAEKGELN
ncbi:MAG: OmpA family protein [Cyclobacteriaceae bacterium]|nr:OmpA family protein [Cyclobacteriaceae bacterium]